MLTPISLPELTATAAMMTRVDRKYLLHAQAITQLYDDLPATTRELDINGVRAQRYLTTYYDTPQRTSYHAAAHKRRRRFKVRTRTYLDTDTTFLEIKTSGPRGTTVKERIRLNRTDAHTPRLPAYANPWVYERLAAHRADPAVTLQLRACLRNGYRRRTLFLPGQGRATVDADLWWDSSAGGHIDGKDLVFVETKSGARPSDVDRLLWAAGHRPVRVSKFGCGLAAMHPELPSNRWRPALQYFSYLKD